MFKFLKEKLKSVVGKFSKEVEEESEEVPIEETKQEIVEEPPKEIEKKPEPKKEKVVEKKPKKEVKEKTKPVEEKKEEIIEAKKEIQPEVKEKSTPVIEEKKEPELVKEEPVKEKVQEPKEKVVVEKKPTKETKVIEKFPEKKETPIQESKEESEEIKQELSKDEETIDIEEVEDEPEEEKTGFFGKLFGKKKKEIIKEPKEEVIKEKPQETAEKKQEEIVQEVKKDSELKEIKKEEPKFEEKPQEEKKGFFGKVSETFTKIHLSDDKFNELFWDIELALLENNMAVEVIEKVKEDLKKELTTEKISRKNTQEIILDTLKKSLDEILSTESIDLEVEIKKKKPYIIAVIGVNGSGKTTAIAKLAHMFKEKGYSIVLAAADTFRAAAIQQLEEHANRLDIKLIKHDYNSDPAAVAFDAVKHAESKGLDIVMIDTAGRLHSNDNLMNELKKLIKVNNPDFKLFVGESITGNDCVEQATKYNELIGIDGIFLTKADIDEKGGAPISISYVTKKPVLFIGTGQTYTDIKPFNKQEILENIGL